MEYLFDGNVMVYIFVACFLLAMPFAIYFILKPGLDDKELRNSVNNTDITMDKFCFLLKFDQQEMIRRLSRPNIHDVLESTLDVDSLQITLRDEYNSVAYQLAFYVVGSTTYLKVYRIQPYCGQTRLVYRVNRFFIEKTGAIPVDYMTFCKLTNSSG